MEAMGHFFVRGRLTGPTGLSEDVDLFVDTGATLLILPRSLADRLDVTPRYFQSVRLAGDQRTVWPRSEVLLKLDEQEITAPCWIVPEGPAILGIVPLEILFLGVDPVQHRLIPLEPRTWESIRAATRPPP